MVVVGAGEDSSDACGCGNASNIIFDLKAITCSNLCGKLITFACMVS